MSITSPTQISGCVLWLDASQLGLTNGASVSSWTSLGTVSYTASSFTNSTPAPSFAAKGQNGLGIVTYRAGSGHSIPNFVLAQTMSVFQVFYPVDQDSGSPFLEHSVNENTNAGFYLYSAGGQNFGINTGSGQVAVNIGNTTLANRWQLIEGINPDLNGNPSGTMSYYVNGGLLASGATQSGSTTVTATLYINGRGGANSVSYNCYMAELIIYNVALSITQRIQVEQYLFAKWGIPIGTSGLLPTNQVAASMFNSPVASPLDIGPCTLWLDASDASTLTLSTNFAGFTESFEYTGVFANSSGITGWTNSPTWNGWSFSGSGIAGCNSPWASGTSTAYDGNYFAYIQSSGTMTSQTFSIASGVTMFLSFAYNYRIGTLLPTSIFVTYAGTQVYTSSTWTSAWIFVSLTFTTTTSSGALVFSSTRTGGGDWALLIDKVVFGPTVSQWNDKSGNSRHASQSTAGNRPSFFNNTINFEKVGQNFAIASMPATPPSDIFIVGKPLTLEQGTSANGGSQNWRTLLRGISHEIMIQYTSTKVGVYDNINSSGFNQFGTLTWDGTQRNMIYVNIDNSNRYQAGMNGSTPLTVNPLTASSATDVISWLGGYDIYQPWGQINEVIIFPTTLTLTQRQKVEMYLANKWNLALQYFTGNMNSLAPVSNLSPTNINISVPVPTTTTATVTALPLIMPNCVLWLDANDPYGTGILPANSTSISTWYDKSFSRNNGVLMAGQTAPVFNTNQQNGLPGMVFTRGASHTAGSGLSVGAIATATNLTFFMVCNFSSYNYPDHLPIAYGVWKVQFSSIFQIGVGSMNADINGAGTGGRFAGSTQVNIGTTNLFTGIINSSTASKYGEFLPYINGVYSLGSGQTSSSTNGPNTNGCAQAVGVGCLVEGGNAYYVFSGNIYEVLLYTTSLSIVQTQQIEGYLAWKWGLQGSLPSSHPYYSSANITNLNPIPSQIATQSSAITSYLPPTPNVTGMNMNLILWLDANDTSTFTYSSGTNISTWYDKSGGTNHATFGGTTNYLTKGANYVSFPGSSGAYFNVPGLAGSLVNTPFLIFIVEQLGAGSVSYRTLFGDNIATNTANQLLDITYRTVNNITCAFNYNDLETTGLSGTGTTRLWTFRLPGANDTFRTTRLNGSIVSTHSNKIQLATFVTPAIGSAGSATGGGLYLGNIYEILIYRGDFTNTQITNIEQYLMNKWAINSYSQSFVPSPYQNMVLWLDASDNTKITTSSGIVTGWTDKSGAGNSVTVITGSPVLSNFRGNQYMYLSNTGFNGSITQNVGQTVIAFAVAALNIGGSSGAYSRLLSLGISSAVDYASSLYVIPFVRSGTGQAIYTQRNGLPVAQNSASAITYTKPFLVTTVYDGTSATLFLNGVAAGSSSSATIQGTFKYNYYGIAVDAQVSDAEWWGGYVGEVIVYHATLPLVQIQQIEGYLAWKWGLQASLSPSHPYFFRKLIAPSLLTFNASFNPLSYGNLALWLDASDFSTLTMNGSSQVSKWSDKSGQGNHFLQATNANKPVYNTYNSGINGLTFNGSTYMTTASTFSLNSGGVQAFCVFTPTNITDRQRMFRYQYLAYIAALDNLYFDVGGPSVYHYVGPVTFAKGATSLASVNMFSAATTSANADPSTSYSVNTASSSTWSYTDVAINQTPALIQLGGNSTLTDTMFTGTIQEILMFDRFFTSVEVKTIEGYLAWKWGFQGSLPRGHPFKFCPPPPY